MSWPWTLLWFLSSIRELSNPKIVSRAGQATDKFQVWASFVFLNFKILQHVPVFDVTESFKIWTGAGVILVSSLGIIGFLNVDTMLNFILTSPSGLERCLVFRISFTLIMSLSLEAITAVKKEDVLLKLQCRVPTTGIEVAKSFTTFLQDGEAKKFIHQ